MEVEQSICARKKQINYKFIPTSLFRGRPHQSPDQYFFPETTQILSTYGV